MSDRSVGVHPDGPGFGGNDSGCVKKTCQPGDCGYVGSDGCGGILDCTGPGGGSPCPSGEYCGGGGPNKCGKGDAGNSNSDAAVAACVPKTASCSQLGYTCGYTGDGCGGVINCNGDGGNCAYPQYCGGGGFNVCGGTSPLTPDGGVQCSPTTCQALKYNCGYANDGCGHLLDCNTNAGGCPAPQFCGGGGFNQCGGNSGMSTDGGSLCVPLTCGQLGFDCGPAGDGCGNVINCYPNNGTACAGAGDTCGGGGIPGVCGHTCTGLCNQPKCDGGGVTTITGKVIAGTLPVYLAAGGSPDPVPNVLVYIPNAPLQPFTQGAQCSPCGADVTGSPLVSTTTAFDGTFTLTNVPYGPKVPVVIQLGRWRREVYVDVPACTTTVVGAAATAVAPGGTDCIVNGQTTNGAGCIRMPRNKSDGACTTCGTPGVPSADIPLTAISTGAVDSLECVMLKMGVDFGEFTNNSGNGRINIFSCAADNGAGASAGAGTQCEEALMGNGGPYMNYDQILFPCWGREALKPAAEQGNLVTYANGGGRFFATHFSYTWLFQNNPFNTTANWDVNHNTGINQMTGNVRLPAPAPAPNNPQGTVFSEWLGLVGALSSTNPPQLSVNVVRHDVDSPLGTSVDWIDGNDPGDQSPMMLHYTFDTPVGSQSQCGHVIYSDFHVNDTRTSPAVMFPGECNTNPLQPQEKVLEYLIWNLASCVGTPPPPKCTPITCQAQNITCGPASDGCGNLIQSCGMCTPPQTCGGGGTPGQCGGIDGGSCTPKTCQEQNINCGPAGNGCGGLIQSCGTCTPPQTCGGGGAPGQCGYPDGGACQPKTCSDQNITCGPAGDGCGNLLQCGTCMAPDTCGAGGVPGQCGSPDAGSCKPMTCGDQGVECGPASDGCGNLLQCGACKAPLTCGGGGIAGKCGTSQ
jgi:hypothetical protein